VTGLRWLKVPALAAVMALAVTGVSVGLGETVLAASPTTTTVTTTTKIPIPEPLCAQEEAAAGVAQALAGCYITSTDTQTTYTSGAMAANGYTLHSFNNNEHSVFGGWVWNINITGSWESSGLWLYAMTNPTCDPWSIGFVMTKQWCGWTTNGYSNGTSNYELIAGDNFDVTFLYGGSPIGGYHGQREDCTSFGFCGYWAY
jgi:hypothetical protein